MQMIDGRLTAKLPRMWVGFAIALLGFLVLVFGAAVQEIRNPGTLEKGSMPIGYYLLFIVAGWIYWLYCVYRFHDVLSQIPGYNHSISPGRAVGMHWIPLYNIYWVFKWPSEIATFVNWRTQSKSMNGKVAGMLVLVSVLVARLLDGSIGLVFLFSSGVYISRRLRRDFTAPPVPAAAMAPFGARGPLGL